MVAGRRAIAFATAPPGEDFEIATIRSTGTALGFLLLTSSTGEDRGPTWSPDGASIAFESDRLGGVSQIFTMPASGEPETILTPNLVAAFDPSWSPDGSAIAHAANDGSEIEIATTPPGGGPTTPLSDGGGSSPSWQTVGAPVPTARCAGVLATLEGTGGDDTLFGTPLVDVVVGLGGDDRINVAEGDDVVCGGGGDDTVVGDDGDDLVNLGAGDDVAKGLKGDDELLGKGGNDGLHGGPGRELANGGAGRDGCSAETEISFEP